MSENSDGQVEKVILNNSLNEAVDRAIAHCQEWKNKSAGVDGWNLIQVLEAMRQPEKTDDQLSSAKSTTIKVISADITKEQLKCDCPYCGKNIILFMPPLLSNCGRCSCQEPNNY